MRLGFGSIWSVEVPIPGGIMVPKSALGNLVSWWQGSVLLCVSETRGWVYTISPGFFT